MNRVAVFCDSQSSRRGTGLYIKTIFELIRLRLIRSNGGIEVDSQPLNRSVRPLAFVGVVCRDFGTVEHKPSSCRRRECALRKWYPHANGIAVPTNPSRFF